MKPVLLPILLGKIVPLAFAALALADPVLSRVEGPPAPPPITLTPTASVATKTPVPMPTKPTPQPGAKFRYWLPVIIWDGA